MKKILTLAVLAAIVAVSCTKKPDDNSIVYSQLTFHAVATNTATDGGASTLWHNGDAISVYTAEAKAANKGAKFTTSLASDQASADFSGEAPDLAKYHAVCLLPFAYFGAAFHTLRCKVTLRL